MLDHCHYTGEYRVLRIGYVIQNIVCIKNFQYLLIMDQTMIIILS